MHSFFFPLKDEKKKKKKKQRFPIKSLIFVAASFFIPWSTKSSATKSCLSFIFIRACFPRPIGNGSETSCSRIALENEDTDSSASNCRRQTGETDVLDEGSELMCFPYNPPFSQSHRKAFPKRIHFTALLYRQNPSKLFPPILRAILPVIHLLTCFFFFT